MSDRAVRDEIRCALVLHLQIEAFAFADLLDRVDEDRTSVAQVQLFVRFRVRVPKRRDSLQIRACRLHLRERRPRRAVQALSRHTLGHCDGAAEVGS